jgi:hypothetical protein
MSFLNAWEYSELYGVHFPVALWRYLIGVHPNDIPLDRIRSDFLLTTFLGTLELISYPVLLQMGSWSVIGAWIGFKTIAQWAAWIKNRNQFNRYLIGNALVLISSVLVLSQLVVANKTALDWRQEAALRYDVF